MRLKGHGGGSFQPIDQKPSLTLDFSRFVPDRHCRGLTKIHLNNSVEDPSYMREWTGTRLFQRAGVPAPEVDHATVRLNRRELGLYVLKEGFAEPFLTRAFGRGDGTLYDTRDGFAAAGGAPDGDPVLSRLVGAATEPNLERRWERMKAVVDVDHFISLVAMEVLIGHWDGYGTGRNNFRIYHRPDKDQLVFLPAGMDQIFANSRLEWRPTMSGAAAKALLETAQGGMQYAQTFRRLCAESMRVETLTNQIMERVARLKPCLEKSVYTEARGESAVLCRQIVDRKSYLEFHCAEWAALTAIGGNLSRVDWRAAVGSARGKLDFAINERPALHIALAGPGAGSWSAVISLPRGRYRFAGLAKTKGIVPLPFGKRNGVALRVRGSGGEDHSLLTAPEWTALQTEFEVREANQEVELLCELRATSGEAWFAKDAFIIEPVKSMRTAAADAGSVDPKREL